MKMLLVDTSGKEIAVAVYSGARRLFEEYIEAKQNYNSVLVPMLDEITARLGIKYADIGLFASTLGPGSFTGIRVGMSAMKGFAQPLGARFTGVTVLEIMVNSLTPGPGRAWAVLEAGRGEIYAACYRFKKGAVETVKEPEIVSPEQFAGMATGKDRVAALKRENTAGRLAAAGCRAAVTELDHVDMAVFARLAAKTTAKEGRERLLSLAPVYVRPSEAEAALKRKMKEKPDR